MNKIFYGLLIVFIISIILVYFIDRRLNNIFDNFIDIEVKKVSNNIVSTAVNKYMSKEKHNEFLIIDYDNNAKINKVSYDTEKVNNFISSFSKYLEDVLLNLDTGSLDSYYLNPRLSNTKFSAIKNGIVCNVTIGAVMGSTLFSSVGPTIPIKITFLGHINTDIDIKIEEYGINNVIVKMYLVINIFEQSSLPLTSKENKIVLRELMAVDIIKGELPNYYGGFAK